MYHNPAQDNSDALIMHFMKQSHEVTGSAPKSDLEKRIDMYREIEKRQIERACLKAAKFG